MKRIAFAGLFLLFVFAAAAPGDTLYLKSGGKFEGQVVEENADSVVFRIKGLGAQTFKRSDIDRIEKGATVYDEYEARRNAMPKGDANARYELGIWCLEQGLRPEGLKAFRAAIELDGDHAGARRALGYTKVRDRWLDRVQLRRYREERRRELEAVLGRVGPGDVVWNDLAKIAVRPPRGWSGEEVSGGTGTEFTGPELHGVTLRLGYECANPLDVKVFKAGVEREIAQKIGEFRPVRADSPTSLGGLLAREDVRRYGPKEAEAERHDVYLEREDGLVHFWFVGPAEDMDALEGAYRDILASVTFEDPKSAAPAGKLFAYDLPDTDWERGLVDGIDRLDVPELGSHVEVIHHSLHPALIMMSADDREADLDTSDPKALREAMLKGILENIPGMREVPGQSGNRKVAGQNAATVEVRGTTQEGLPVEMRFTVLAKGDKQFFVIGMNFGGSMDMRYFRKDYEKLLDSFRLGN